jgi:hypothetical protein
MKINSEYNVNENYVSIIYIAFPIVLIRHSHICHIYLRNLFWHMFSEVSYHRCKECVAEKTCAQHCNQKERREREKERERMPALGVILLFPFLLHLGPHYVCKFSQRHTLRCVLLISKALLNQASWQFKVVITHII